MKNYSISVLFASKKYGRDFLHPKILRIKRAILFFMTINIWCMTATGYSQVNQLTVTVDIQSGTLKDVILSIEEQSDYTFVYPSEGIDLDRKVSLSAAQRNLTDLLDELFSGESIGYHISDHHIALYRKAEARQQRNRTINGVVLDEQGEAVIGANVVVNGTTIGTVTDMDGHFTLEVPESGVMRISYIGYLTQDIRLSADRALYNITMREDTETLDEVVVVGYGTIKKSDVTGSVVSVSTDDMIKRNPITLEEGLQGMAPGVQVVRTSGDPGGGVTVRIRGTATINNDADPLYVVDGIMVGTNANFLNPSDVESIEVLKDASATAIYGSRGANGVIMITTKKGTKGRTNLTFNANFGIQTLSKKLDVTNAEQFAIAANQTAINDGTALNPVWANPAALNNIDWQDEMSRVSLRQTYNLSVSGGSENTQSMMSVSYMNNDGIIIESNYKRLTARANVNHKVKDFIRTGVNLSYMYSENDGGGNLLNYASLIHTMDTLAADGSGRLVHVPVQYPDGTWEHFPREGNGFNNKGADNPVAAAKTRDSRSYNHRVVSSTFVEVDLLKGLNFKSVGGVNYSGGSYHGYSQVHHRTYIGNDTDDFNVSQWQNTEFLLENYFTYDETFNKKHHLTLLAGHSVSRYKPQDLEASSSIFPASSIRRIELTSDPGTLNASGGSVGNRASSRFSAVLCTLLMRNI